jgi:hypothetical protein
MFQLRAQLLYLIITTILGERQAARSIVFNEMGNDNILINTNGQKPMQEETHLNEWGHLQLDGGVAVLDVTVRTPRSADQAYALRRRNLTMVLE